MLNVFLQSWVRLWSSIVVALMQVPFHEFVIHFCQISSTVSSLTLKQTIPFNSNRIKKDPSLFEMILHGDGAKGKFNKQTAPATMAFSEHHPHLFCR